MYLSDAIVDPILLYIPVKKSVMAEMYEHVCSNF